MRQRGRRDVPAYLGPVLRTHWGVEDPAHVTGSDEVIDRALVTAYLTLRARIEALFALPLDEYSPDRSRPQRALDRISAEVQ